jgi:hypothetical protein
MCNLCSITTNQQAIRALFRVVSRCAGKLLPMPRVMSQSPPSRNVRQVSNYLTMDTRMDKPTIRGTTSAAAIIFTLAHLLVPVFATAQTMEPTESVNVLDANSASVATLFVPRSSIQASEVAVLINDNDPQSVEVANYYQRVRNIPSQNMIHVNFDQDKIYPSLTANYGIDPADFAVLKEQVDAAAGPEIQAFVISWSKPFRIARFNYYPTNYSITSAFTYGVDANHLTSNNCGDTPVNAYYDSQSTKPYADSVFDQP